MKNRWLQKIRAIWVQCRQPDMAPSFKADQQKELAYEAVSRGTRTVVLDRIVGSVGRYHDFDSRFKPIHLLDTERYRNIKQALLKGRVLPPVKLYQIKDNFYVLDGNHRIAAAKELRHKEIRATILEFMPSQDTLENILYTQRSRFVEQSGLPYTIMLTEVGQYDHLMDQIVEHKKHLNQTGHAVVDLKAAALDWYETIYRPLVAIIRKGNLLRFFPQRTLDDLYAYIAYQQWVRGQKRKYGIGIDRLIPNNMETFREKMANTCQSEYPEMLREITVFVLMNVAAKNEDDLMDKLFALKEIQEIHAIHGDADILAKVVLTRDLLSSDAEIISEFVHVQMRQLPGVISTKTLIPGRSMIKTSE